MRNLCTWVAISALLTAPAWADDQQITLENSVPSVIKTEPAAGTDGVDPKLTSIRVTFSKPMRDGSWSWVQLSDDSFPQMKGKPRYLDDGKTCVLDVELQPNHTYAVWINSEKYRNFKDKDGRSAPPYYLVFRTGKAAAK